MTFFETSTQLIDRFVATRILCVGDLMLDRFVYGEVSRISPEAPVPVVRIERETLMLGGAGNVVRNLGALGAGSVFVALRADDSAGTAAAGLIALEPRVEPRIPVVAGGRTTEKVRFIAGTQQLLRADWERPELAGGGLEARLLAEAETGLCESGAAVLSDYGKGVLTRELTAALLAGAAKRGIPTVVDPKGADYSRYRGAFVATPNRAELALAVGHPVAGDAEIASAAAGLIARSGIRNLLVTRSQDGMTLVEESGRITHIPARAREVFDVSGAGDTVVAVLAAALAAGADLAEAARLANLAGGIVVGKAGTATASAAELKAAVRELAGAGSGGKRMDRATARAKAASWRDGGLVVGFTNGCFDLLHPGHISLLRQARRACDRLIVAVNSDASVARLKGSARPVQNEAARVEVLSALSDVDGVVVFSEDTPLALIDEIRPDVLVKGADYTLDTVVGADRVASWGGRVVLAELAPGFSTTNTINRLRGA